MKWSWKLGKIAGIDVYLHATFVLLLAFVGITHWLTGRSLDAVAGGILFITALFACVLLHELGHALAARRFGIPTRDIILLPIGGVARLERMPEKPSQELWVALAGPAVNVVIAAGLYAVLLLGNTWVPVERLTVAGGPLLERLFVANIWLVLFNMVPAFPMDGGRVLRALLATRTDYVRATRIAAGLGQGLALVFGLLGLFGNPMLIFIALFVWIGASQEAGAVEMKGLLGGVPVRAAMVTDFHALAPSDTLGEAASLILRGSQQEFPVLAAGRLAGLLTRADILSGLARHDDNHPVSEMMRRDFPSAAPREMLSPALERMQQAGWEILPVMEEDRLVGLLTADNVTEFVLIQRTVRERAAARLVPKDAPAA